MTSTRRDFLKTGVLATTGLVVGVYLSDSVVASAPSQPVVFNPNAYVAITPDNVIIPARRSDGGRDRAAGLAGGNLVWAVRAAWDAETDRR